MLDETAKSSELDWHQFLRSIHSLFHLYRINACTTISGRASGRNSGCLARGQTGRLALLRFPAQRSARLSDFEAGRKYVRLTALVLLRPSLGRAGQNCTVDRAVQTRLASRQENCVPRLAGITRATAGSARRGGEGIKEAHCDAVFADERHPLHLTRGCRNNRARPLVWGRTRHER